MKLGQLRTKTIEDTDPGDLDTAVLAFMQAQGEAVFISFHYAAESGFFSVCIVFMK